MNKIKIWLLVLLMIFVGCGGNKGAIDENPVVGSGTGQTDRDEASSDSTPTENLPEESNGNKVTDPSESPVSEPSESEADYIEINFSEPITLDFAEIVIDGASVGDELKPDAPDRVYRYISDVEDEKHFYIYGTIKNVSGDQYEFADNMYAAICFDEKYNYSASVTADEGGNFSYIYAYLDPLKSEKFYIIASVPDELIEQYAQAEVKFGFKENFEDEYGITESECDYLYSITVTK